MKEYNMEDILKDIEDIDLGTDIDGFNPYDSVIEVPDYTQIQQKALNDAHSFLSGVISFFYTKKIINENQYIRLKANQQVNTVRAIEKQIVLMEKMIERVFKLTDTGELSPKIFDSFANLQKTLMELVVLREKLTLNAEESHRKLRDDIDYYNELNSVKITEGSRNEELLIENVGNENKLTYKGNRKLIEELESNEEKIEFLNPHDD
jgi:hypothetical protein